MPSRTACRASARLLPSPHGATPFFSEKDLAALTLAEAITTIDAQARDHEGATGPAAPGTAEDFRRQLAGEIAMNASTGVSIVSRRPVRAARV